jgi:hypothetical protein
MPRFGQTSNKRDAGALVAAGRIPSMFVAAWNSGSSHGPNNPPRRSHAPTA